MSERITIDQDYLNGEPCIRKTRIPVALITYMVDLEMSVDRILKAFPELDPEDIVAALDLFGGKEVSSDGALGGGITPGSE